MKFEGLHLKPCPGFEGINETGHVWKPGIRGINVIMFIPNWIAESLLLLHLAAESPSSSMCPKCLKLHDKSSP